MRAKICQQSKPRVHYTHIRKRARVNSKTHIQLNFRMIHEKCAERLKRVAVISPVNS